MKKLSGNRTKYLIVLIIVFFTGILGFIILSKKEVLPSYEFLAFVKTGDTFTLEKGDLIVRPNINYLPGASRVESGRMFGHMAIVVEGSEGKTIDEALTKAIVIEVFAFDQPTRTFVFDSKRQVRKVSAIVPFGKRFAGIRYRLRTKLTNDQKEKISQFLEQRISKHKYNIFSFKSGKFDNKSLNCATLCWFAFKYTVGIDIDANKGILVYPSDCIRSEYFNGSMGRVRF